MISKHIEQIYRYVYSTPADSPEREKRLLELNDADSEALFNYVVNLRSGRINDSDIDSNQKEENKMFMGYQEWLEAKKNTCGWRNAVEMDGFEKAYPETVRAYKEREKAEDKKRKEIMSIKDNRKRHDAIAENLGLFNSFSGCEKKERVIHKGHTVADLQKRSEILAIKDSRIRRRAIAENMHLFE